MVSEPAADVKVNCVAPVRPDAVYSVTLVGLVTVCDPVPLPEISIPRNLRLLKMMLLGACKNSSTGSPKRLSKGLVNVTVSSRSKPPWSVMVASDAAIAIAGNCSM